MRTRYLGVSLLLCLLLLAAIVQADPVTRDLVAGDEVVGTLTVTDDGSTVYLNFQANAPWLLLRADAYVDAPAPSTGDPETFPYTATYPDGVSSCTLYAPLKWGYTLVNIAAHAVVMQPGEAESVPQETDVVTVPLVCWQKTDGNVSVKLEPAGAGDDSYLLQVQLNAPTGWGEVLSRLYVGNTPPSDPCPFHFPYKHNHLKGAASDTYLIPLDEVGAGDGDTVYFAAYTLVRRLLFKWRGFPIYWYRGLWGDGESIAAHHWRARYFSGQLHFAAAPESATQITLEAWAEGDAPLPSGDGSYFEYQATDLGF